MTDVVTRGEHTMGIAPSFEQAVIDRDAAPVLVVHGEIDVSTAPELHARLRDLVEQGHAVVIVDLSDVLFVDSTALSVLVSARAQQRERGGDLRLVITEPRVLKVFAITGLHDLFSIYADVAAAR